jgi:hypothetical protein
MQDPHLTLARLPAPTVSLLLSLGLVSQTFRHIRNDRLAGKDRSCS